MADVFSVDEVLAMAEQIERNGARFYRAAAAATDDPQVRAALEKLAAWEDGHERTFSSMRESLAAEELAAPAFDPDGEAELYLRAIADQQVFSRSDDPAVWLAGARTPADVLRRAVQFERDAIVFFLGLRDAIPDRLGRDRVAALIDEEVGHVAWLGGELKRLSAAQAGG